MKRAFVVKGKGRYGKNLEVVTAQNVSGAKHKMARVLYESGDVMVEGGTKSDHLKEAKLSAHKDYTYQAAWFHG